jgi:oligopeptide/dipeptide ABC transporter ATP-binding protein
MLATEAEMRHIRGNSIAMVFQEPTTSLNPVLTVKRQISESLELHRGMDKNESFQETVRLLKLVGIPDAEKRANDYPFQFSGGMQQRIMIAMALSCNPSLLICDEPTTSLDVTVQAQLLEIIDGLRERFGTSVVTITHNLGIVARYVDRVNVMYAGKIVETAPTEELYERPCHPYTIGLLASVPRLDVSKKKSLRMIKGLPPNLAHLPGGCPFHPRCDWAMPKCRVEYPPVEKVGENHYRACFAELSKLKKQ